MNFIVFSLTLFHSRIPHCVWQSCLLSLFQFGATSLSFLIFGDLALSLSLIFSDLDTLEDIAQLFCRKYCIWGLLMFAHGETEVVCCWEKHPEAAPSPRVSCWGAWCPRIIPVRLPWPEPDAPEPGSPWKPATFPLDWIFGRVAMHISCFCLDFE